MNYHYVPDFEIQMNEKEEEEYQIPIPSSAPKKHSVQNDEIMELVWQNGQVAFQSQNQRELRKPPSPVINTGEIPAAREAENYRNQNLFMQEDEMASWLNYPIGEDPPLDHRDFCDDMLYAPPNHGGATEIRPVEAPRPPISPARRIQSFAHFVKRGNARAETAAVQRESTVVDSCETPAATPTVASVLRRSPEHGENNRRSASAAGKEYSSSGGRATATATETFEMTVTSSPGGTSGSAKRKRKGCEAEDSEFQSEDADFDSPEAKIQVRSSTSTRRSRAAEVHNLSERRRRDRINEKMKALQELIPRSNKTDKASMLDEAIEYLKSLQLQVQMMSMGCGMFPMMVLPGIQQYMPAMGMGIGMGMGMEMGMNRPVMSFPNMLPKSTLPAATTSSHLGPRFPMPPFHVLHHVPGPDSSTMQVAPNQSDNMLNSLATPDPHNQSRIPNFTDPNQQFLDPHLMHLHLMKIMNQPNATKPSTSKGQENPEKHQPGQS